MADEPKIVSLGAYGPEMNFFRLKGWVEALLNDLDVGKLTFDGSVRNFNDSISAVVYRQNPTGSNEFPTLKGSDVSLYLTVDPEKMK